MRLFLQISGGVLIAALVLGIYLSLSTTVVEDKILNIYSSRHYQTDEALYDDFTRATGITINRLDGNGDELIERMVNEGLNSPADILITVDVGRLWRADQAELLVPTSSQILNERVPENLRHPDGRWFGFSSRARIIFYNKSMIEDGEITRYEDLADPRWRGKICIRSSGNVYNLSLMASMIEHHGLEAAETWARGLVANFARNPQGGDTDQIRAVASGECAIAVANSYYFARLMLSDNADDQAVVAAVGVVFPNQEDRGTHVNISGAGVLAHAPHPNNAILFLEYLVSSTAQAYFAQGNNEYPVVAGVLVNPALLSLGAFKTDQINVAVFGKNQPDAQRAMDRAGWQ